MIIISGANSLIARLLGKSFDNREIFLFDNDIRDVEYINELFECNNPDIFINCDEINNLDEAEYNRSKTYGINSYSVRSIADICEKRNIYFVQLSSSHVFNGEKNVPYKEDDAPGPVSVYGDSKLLGEKYLIRSGCRHLIIRLTEIYGLENSLINWAINKINNNQSIDVIKGNFICPNYAYDGATAVYNLVEDRAEGVFHFCQDGCASVKEFIEFGLRIFYKEKGYTPEYSINELDIADFQIAADSPGFNVLDTGKYCKQIDDSVRDWKTALNDYTLNYLLSNK